MIKERKKLVITESYFIKKLRGKTMSEENSYEKIKEPRHVKKSFEIDDAIKYL